jgi:L-asparaginase
VAEQKPRIAVFAGPTATILNSAPLVTSNQAREAHGLPLLADATGRALPFDVLRPQRLAAPVTIYVEQFSAHPLERDAAHLYAEPDGYVGPDGAFRRARVSDEDVPVYEVVLRPEDGLVPLPYMARRSDGSAWDGDATVPSPRPEETRQPFYPDASRVFEEIDRLGVDERGVGNQLAARAEYDFIRVLPPGGYPTGRGAAERTDVGEGDIEPEEIWRDYFPYRPPNLRREPPRPLLARLTNRVQAALADGRYLGALWLEGSPFIEETIYWLNLLIDTPGPIVGCASADWPHGVLSAAGDRHLVDAVRYVCSRVWAAEDGRDRVGAVLVSSEQLLAAREVQKADARPGGHIVTGGHGGIVGSTGEPGPPVLTYIPIRRHTHRSDVRVSQLPEEVAGVRRSGQGATAVPVAIKAADGTLLPDAIPHVSFHKHARYLAPDASASPDSEVELLARIERNLDEHPLAGFVVEGGAPYGSSGSSADAALRRATFLGMPVVRTARGNAEGFVARERVRLGVAGSNLTATKARLLLMACLMRFGALPPAADPDRPTEAEVRATEAALDRFQAVFDTH